MLIAGAITCGLIIFACTKKDFGKEETLLPNNVNSSEPVVENAISDNSSYGFLVFDDSADVVDYVDFVLTHTHYEVKDYIDQQGFNVNFDKYGSEYDNEPVTEEQLIDYFINEDSIVQIQGVIIRPVDNFSYTIAMMPSELNAETYAMLQSGTFEFSKMCRFLYRDDYGPYDLTSDMEIHGGNSYDEYDSYNNIEPPTSRKNPMFGWGPVKVSPGTPFNPNISGCNCGGWPGVRHFHVLWVVTVDTKPGVKCAPCL